MYRNYCLDRFVYWITTYYTSIAEFRVTEKWKKKKNVRGPRKTESKYGGERRAGSHLPRSAAAGSPNTVDAVLHPVYGTHIRVYIYRIPATRLRDRAGVGICVGRGRLEVNKSGGKVCVKAIGTLVSEYYYYYYSVYYILYIPTRVYIVRGNFKNCAVDALIFGIQFYLGTDRGWSAGV